jgi:hypothetical protein
MDEVNGFPGESSDDAEVPDHPGGIQKLLVGPVIGAVTAGPRGIKLYAHVDTRFFLSTTAAIKLGSVNVNCLIKSEVWAELMNSRTGSRPSSGSTIRRGESGSIISGC